ncbi:MAG: glycosyl transferase [Lachnospiraceae bacterium]|nr:glycosyl transferase [Lachnospiraceae bacterium]
MNILILSSATGGGHNAAGEAIQEKLLAMGHNAVFLDIFTLSSQRTANFVAQAYIRTARNFPRLFGLLYKTGAAVGKFLYRLHIKSPVYLANSLMARPLQYYLDIHDFDAIVMPHLFPAETVTYMKRHGMLSIPTIAVATDYTCIPFWEETGCDYYMIPHEDLTEEFSAHGIPREKLVPCGIPVKSQFTLPKDTEAARAKLNLPADKRIYLIMSGSMGFGSILLFSFELARRCKNGEQIVIICGNNRKLRHTLKHEFRHNQNVHIVGYTTHVADYMDACDVIYTKPGGLTSTEALVKHVPIVHTAPIPGCETRNREFFVSRGMSVAAQHIRTQVAQGRMLLETEAVRNGMVCAQQIHARPDAAERICSLLESLTSPEDLCG